MPLRILYLHHVNQLSGAENSLRLLLRSLSRDHVIPLFGGPETGPFPEALRRDGVPVLPLRFGAFKQIGKLARAVVRVSGLIRRARVDLVHANGPQTNLCAGLAGRLTRVPVVWHARNLIYGKMWDVDRMLAGLPARIICNSDAIRERFRGSRGWEKSVTVLSGVDTREFHPGISREPFRAELGIPAQEPAIGLVGRIGLGKGHESFVEAAGKLIRAGSIGQFLIVGEALFPEDRWRVDLLRRQIDEARMGDRIRFTGFRRDMPFVMRGLDVLVVTSDAEPCGRVLLEAMASGTAIVATNSGGTPELVGNAREGILVAPRDPDALAHAIGRLIDDPTLRLDMGRAGVTRARKDFSMEHFVAQTLDVYELTLKERAVKDGRKVVPWGAD